MKNCRTKSKALIFVKEYIKKNTYSHMYERKKERERENICTKNKAYVPIIETHIFHLTVSVYM